MTSQIDWHSERRNEPGVLNPEYDEEDLGVFIYSNCIFYGEITTQTEEWDTAVAESPNGMVEVKWGGHTFYFAR